MLCPHCHHAINPQLVKSAAAKLIRLPKPKILTPCKWCGLEFGVYDLRQHKPGCALNPRPRRRA